MFTEGEQPADASGYEQDSDKEDATNEGIEGEWEVIRKEQRTESYGSFWTLGTQFSPEEGKEQEGIIRKQLKF